MTNAPYPLISIVIPTYNREKYIADAIDSIIAQTYSNWEIIIVDDCSTDNTRALVADYQTQYPIQYLMTERAASGASRARNIGVQAAQGEFVMFLDSDDVYYPDALMALYQASLQQPDRQVWQGFLSSVDMDLNPIKTQGIDLIPHPSGQGYVLPYSDSITWESLMKGEVCASLTTCLIRRTVFEVAGPLREDLKHWEDFEYIVRMHKNFPGGLLPVPHYIVKYRSQPQSTSRSAENNQRMMNCYLSVLDGIFNDPDLPAEVRKNWRSLAYARVFRVLCRIHLKSGRNCEARQLAFQAMQHPAFDPKQWLFKLGPIVWQSFLSPTLYEKIATTNRALKLRLLSLCQPLIKGGAKANASLTAP
jgi:glycosyltransferase involved in cell wall biosynthesis